MHARYTQFWSSVLSLPHQVHPSWMRRALIATVMLAPSNAAAQGGPAPNALMGEFGDKVLLALLGAVLGFVSSYAITSLQRRRTRKQLSYDTTIVKAKSPIDTPRLAGGTQSPIKVTYEGQSVDELSLVLCEFVNTGQTKIKDQYIRVTFPKSVRILDLVYDPEPKREQGVGLDKSWPVTANERRFHIGDLEPKERVGFQFIVTGSSDAVPEIVPRAEDDVEVVPRSRKRERDDADKARDFIIYAILYWAGSAAAHDLGFLIAPLVQVLLFIPLLPYLPAFARFVVGVLARLGATPSEQATRTDVSIRGSVVGALAMLRNPLVFHTIAAQIPFRCACEHQIWATVSLSSVLAAAEAPC